MGVWVAAAHLLLPLLLLLLLLMQLPLPLLQDLIVKDPLKFSSHLYLEENHSLEMSLFVRLADKAALQTVCFAGDHMGTFESFIHLTRENMKV